MAKFCSNCGTQLDDNTRFCTNCGATVDQPEVAQQPQYQPEMSYVPPVDPQYQPEMNYAPHVNPQPQPQPKPKKSKKGLIIGLSIGGALLLIGIIIGILFATGVLGGTKYDNTPSGAVEQLMDGFMEADGEKVMNSMPSFQWDDNETLKQGQIIEMNLFLKSSFSVSSYEILSESSLTYYEMEELEYQMQNYKYMYDTYNANDISEYKKVTVQFTATFEGETDTITTSFIVIKYKGEWKVLEFDF